MPTPRTEWVKHERVRTCNEAAGAKSWEPSLEDKARSAAAASAGTSGLRVHF